MNSASRQELFDYYNERSPEYEDFYWGKLKSQILDPDIYKNDTLKIQKLLPDYVSGKCIDIACGTGFWLPVYEKNCTEITLIDQSESVLAECSKKIQKLGIENRIEIIRGDLFRYPFNEQEFDCAIIGFLISHLYNNELDTLFAILSKMLIPDGSFAIIDSIWNSEIARIKGRDKSGMTRRSLGDGREFNIYKRYFEKQDLCSLADKHRIKLEILYWGNVFFLATGYYIVP